MKKTIAISILSIGLLSACNNKDHQFDATGTFEAEEIIISAEATGVLKQFELQEGQKLATGQWIGYIDSTQLYLKKRQLQAQSSALISKKPNVALQLSALKEQLRLAFTEQRRIQNLVKADAATTKQLDDINGQVQVIQRQIAAQESSLKISNSGIANDAKPIELQIAQIEDQLSKCRLQSPMNGTVLSKYVEQNEMATMGKPLFKMADLSTLILRAYITGKQLPEVKLNQKVKVHTDDGKGGFNEEVGIVTWISSKAEFTPKTIQTKDERANLVYAIKVLVKNDGRYKIGMYGEINFQ